jgi:hypothetical protein
MIIIFVFITNNVEKPVMQIPLETQETCKRQTFMLEAGFELRIQRSERSQTHALGRAGARMGS